MANSDLRPGPVARQIRIRNQIFVALLVAILLYFVVSYIRLVLEHGELREEVRQATADLQVSREQELRLERQLQYVRTDAYRETAAREHLGMAREGDTVVAIVSDGRVVESPVAAVATEEQVDILSLPIWQQWMALFNLELASDLSGGTP